MEERQSHYREFSGAVEELRAELDKAIGSVDGEAHKPAGRHTRAVGSKDRSGDRSHAVRCQINSRWRQQLQREVRRFDGALPVYAHRQEVVEALRNHQIAIITAETGSGKTTQLCQYFADSLGVPGKMIACTQPRRLAATSVAKRVAEEWLGPGARVGGEVGHRVGGSSVSSRETVIKFLTDSMLVHESLSDPRFSNYWMVIVDEAHERSIDTDILLGLLQNACRERADLKVVVTSATIDPAVFHRHFSFSASQPHLMTIPGRTFPIVDTYLESPVTDYIRACVDTVQRIHETEASGDVLVFLPKSDEIEAACRQLRQRLGGSAHPADVYPLYGQLKQSEQDEVLQYRSAPENARRRLVVCSTNIAETSLTIPGVKYVVDSGMANESRYDAARRMTVLEVCTITKASANQRRGRAGRTSPGKCFRMYTREEFEDDSRFAPNQTPEILRSHLDMSVLRLVQMRLNPATFPFPTRPNELALEAAIDSLIFLGALTAAQRSKASPQSQALTLTELGAKMAQLPLDPPLSRMILVSAREPDLQCSVEAAKIAAILTAPGVLFYRGKSDSERESSEQSRLKFSHPSGDHLTLLAAFEAWFAAGRTQKTAAGKCAGSTRPPGSQRCGALLLRVDECKECRKHWALVNSVNNKVAEAALHTLQDLQATLRDIGVAVVSMPDSISGEERARRLLLAISSGFFQNACRTIALQRAKPVFTVLQTRSKALLSKESAVLQHRDSWGLAGVGAEGSATTSGKQDWVVFFSLVQTANVFLVTSSRVLPDWLRRWNSEWYDKFVGAEEDAVSELVFDEVGPAVLWGFVGRAGENIRRLESQLDCLVDVEEESGRVVVTTTQDTATVRAAVEADLARFVQAAEAKTVSFRMSEKNLRLEIGSGVEVKSVRLLQDCDSIRIIGLPVGLGQYERELKRQLSEMFGSHGKVDDIRVFGAPRPDRSSGHGGAHQAQSQSLRVEIRFSETQSAAAACAATNGLSWKFRLPPSGAARAGSGAGKAPAGKEAGEQVGREVTTALRVELISEKEDESHRWVRIGLGPAQSETEMEQWARDVGGVERVVCDRQPMELMLSGITSGADAGPGLQQVFQRFKTYRRANSTTGKRRIWYASFGDSKDALEALAWLQRENVEFLGQRITAEPKPLEGKQRHMMVLFERAADAAEAVTRAAAASPPVGVQQMCRMSLIGDDELWKLYKAPETSGKRGSESAKGSASEGNSAAPGAGVGDGTQETWKQFDAAVNAVRGKFPQVEISVIGQRVVFQGSVVVERQVALAMRALEPWFRAITLPLSPRDCEMIEKKKGELQRRWAGVEPGVVVQINVARKQVALRGNPVAQAAALRTIEKELEAERGGMEEHVLSSAELAQFLRWEQEGGLGVLKRRLGVSCEVSVIRSGGQVRGGRLNLTGAAAGSAAAEIKAKLETMQQKAAGGSESSKGGIKRQKECVVCGGAAREAMQLQRCGDFACRACLRACLLSESGAGRFPICCPRCKHKVLPADWQACLDSGSLEMMYTQASKTALLPCLTPGCDGYCEKRVKTDFSCAKCKNRYCLECHVDRNLQRLHEGKTCAEYQEALRVGTKLDLVFSAPMPANEFVDGLWASMAGYQPYRLVENPQSQPGSMLYERFRAAHNSLPQQRLVWLFHGTTEAAARSICKTGFDPSRRGSAVGQVLGPGEYLAPQPQTSLGYCRGSKTMLLCLVSLGVQGVHHTYHEWAYVIKGPVKPAGSPETILPRYVITWDPGFQL
eukprot:TRINITY_DN1712_c0_g1_i1.p1 TRINITY_DN1712_c0_g1~~TRINITY_DN1712_c0_g1_i1.p1  ORF type:complete len:1898 (+),score=359.08 TRINITY_DN1712_c0_g1_i1:458-5695(+)